MNQTIKMLHSIKEEYYTLMDTLKPKPVELKAFIPDVIRILQEKVNPEGLRLEICGNWLWLSGKTFNVIDALKEPGFRYSKSKLSWYRRAEENRSSYDEPIPIDMIRLPKSEIK